jgi:hypothetical protein
MAIQDPMSARRALMMSLVNLPKLGQAKPLADEIADRLLHDGHDDLAGMTIDGMYDFMDEAVEANLTHPQGEPEGPSATEREAVVHAIEDELIHQTAQAIGADLGPATELAVESAIRQKLSTEAHAPLDSMPISEAIGTMVEEVLPDLQKVYPNYQGLSDVEKDKVLNSALRGFEMTVAVSIANRLVPADGREPGGLPNPGADT